MKNKIIGFLIITLISIANIANAETIIANDITKTYKIEDSDKPIETKEYSNVKIEEVKSEPVNIDKNNWKKTAIILFYIVCLFTGGGIVFI